MVVVVQHIHQAVSYLGLTSPLDCLLCLWSRTRIWYQNDVKYSDVLDPEPLSLSLASAMVDSVRVSISNRPSPSSLPS